MRTTTYSETDVALLKRLEVLSSATVYESMGKIGALSSSIKPVDPSSKICGFAFTVSGKSQDNLALHNAIYMVQPCEVIVATVEGYTEAGYWGDVMTTAAKCRQLSGLVFDGSVRDSREIIESGFPIFCCGVCIKETEKNFLGNYNIPIEIGNVIIRPGDFILGDCDGVVSIPRERFYEVEEKALERMNKEVWIMGELKNKRTTLDIYNLAKNVL